MSDIEDVEARYHDENGASKSTALTTVATSLPDAPRPTVTPAQAKVDAIANLTFKAYELASQLVLTADEIANLKADFPDEAFRSGAAGKESLIYIEHAYLRDRLNQVFGPGQWCIVPRSRWAEEGQKGTIIYVEAMLLIRGCFVAEAIGDMTYYPHNAQTNYGDAVEGAKSAALRRCAKELGIGLQAWKKSFCEAWWKRKTEAAKQPRQAPPQAPQQPAQKPAETPKKSEAAKRPETITDAQGDELTKAMQQHGATWKKLSAHYGITRLGLLPAMHFADAMKNILAGKFK